MSGGEDREGSAGEGSPLELDPETMRRLGHAVVDRVVERWARLREEPVSGPADREAMEELLREPLPRAGDDDAPSAGAAAGDGAGAADRLEAAVERFWRDVAPHAGRIDHPRFFAFIPSSPTFASVLGDWLVDGCNFFAGTWIESPGPSEVELVVLDWLKEALGYPDKADGVLTSGGSAANLMGLAVAREEKLGGRPADGVAYCSDQTHTAVDRALRILGFPEERLRRLPSDEGWRLSPGRVAEAVEEDRDRGLRPFCVVGNAGTTNTGAVDPLGELAELCRREDLWLHVDGAYGAFARLAAREGEGREDPVPGLERADSLVLDPHKWMYVGYEAGCLLVRRPGALKGAFHVLPDYLQDTATQEGEVNFADYGLQLTRRARAVKVWLSLKAHGVDGVAGAVDRTIRLAERAEEGIRERPELELMAPASLGVVCFRHRGAGSGAGDTAPGEARADDGLDAHNRRVVERIQREGDFMISSTRLGGRYTIRLCPMNYRTREEDVAAVLDEVVRVGGAAG